MSDITYGKLEEAYQAAVIGDGEPSLLAVKGSTLLKFRPDLEGSIDPTKSYLVGDGKITLIEEGE